MWQSQREAAADGQQVLYDLARHFMWQRRGDHQFFIDNKQACYPLEEDYEKAREQMGKMVVMTTYGFQELYSLDTLDVSNTKEETMYTEAQERTAYLERRLYRIEAEKSADLSKKYHIYSYGPTTVKELKEFLKKGQFSINLARDYDFEKLSEDDDFSDYTSWHSLIDWSEGKKDKKGYEAAIAQLTIAKTKAADVIHVRTDDAAAQLKALEEFESFSVN